MANASRRDGRATSAAKGAGKAAGGSSAKAPGNSRKGVPQDEAPGTGGGVATARRDDERELRQLLDALTAVRDGNFRRRLSVSGDGLMGEVAAVFNDVVDRNQHLANELARVRRVVGREGKLSERFVPGPGRVPGRPASTPRTRSSRTWSDPPSRSAGCSPRSPRATCRSAWTSASGTSRCAEFNRMGRTVNGLVDQLSAFTNEVTRVAREVGTEGKLGGQAQVRGVSGSWKDLTDSVNTMASRLTAQVRDIALVTTAVAKGDLSRKVTVEVAGEMLELKITVNTMVDQLSGFADEVTRMAREVGTEDASAAKRAWRVSRAPGRT